MRVHLITLGLVAAAAVTAAAHVGTSNAYFEGAAGPYGIRVIVRTPGVIPGLAQASVRILSGAGVERVTVRPLRSDVGLDGAPPPDVAGPVGGDRDLYSGELWLMTSGSYSIEVSVAGAAGEGTVFVPVMAVAERSLEMQRAVGLGLAGAALFLFFGAVTIFGAAVRESVLEPGRGAGPPRPPARAVSRRCSPLPRSPVTLAGGWSWWNAVDAAYRSRIYEPWSTSSAVAMTAGAALLTLAIDDPEWVANRDLPGAALLPDHGKLMHMFLVEADALSAFAHVHPAPAGEDVFEVALPPLPPGEYRIFADIVLENGFAPTLVDTVRVPGSAAAATEPARACRGRAAGRRPDARPGRFVGRAAAARRVDVPGIRAAERPHAALGAGWGGGGRRGDDAALCGIRAGRVAVDPRAVHGDAEPRRRAAARRLGVRAPASRRQHQPHGAAALRGGGSGSRRSASPAAVHMRMRVPDGPSNSVTFPFVFPQPGAWRLFVQVKIGDTVETAAFDVEVEDPAGA